MSVSPKNCLACGNLKDDFGFCIKCDVDDDDWLYDDENCDCWYCGGQGWGLVGADWDMHDAINGPYNGEIEECPCCRGSGDAEDCTFW